MMRDKHENSVLYSIFITSILEHLNMQFGSDPYRILINAESNDSDQFEYEVIIQFYSSRISLQGCSIDKDPVLALCKSLSKATSLLGGPFVSRRNIISQNSISN